MDLKGLKINFLGDSITFGAQVQPDEIFHAVLKEEAGLSEARNYGIGGTRYALQTTKDGWRMDDVVDVNSFCERYDQMDDDADMVVVFGGTNDYGHGNAELGTPDDRTADTFYGACHVLFSGLIKKYLGKPIIIMTPTHRINEMDRKGELAREYGALIEYVTIIREVAEYYSLPVLDLYKESGIQPEIDEVRAAFMPDGLHPNAAGHKMIAEKLKHYLETL